MTSFLRKLLLVYWLCLCAAEARAQYQFDRWTTDDGLPQNSIYDIEQTADGYLWLATVDGLARFDGVRFTVFNKSNSPGIANNRFISLFEDVNGDLWAGTESSGVTRLRSGKFTSYGTAQGLAAGYVGAITNDGEGNVFTFSDDYKISRFAGEKFSAFDPPPMPRPDVSGEENKMIPCQLVGADQYVRCFSGGNLFDVTSGKELIYWSNVLGNKTVLDKNETIWMAQPSNGLLKYERDENGKYYRVITNPPGRVLALVNGAERLLVLSLDEQKMLWLTDTQTMQSELVMRQAPETLEYVYDAFEDDEGSIWIGTPRGGLFRLRKQFITAFSKSDGLLENNVYPIYANRAGTIFIGTTNGVYKYENNRFEAVKGAENTNTHALGETPDGRLLISSEGDVFVLEDDRLTKTYTNQASNATYSFYNDETGALWMGGSGGLVRMKNGFTEDFTEQNGLAARDIKIIISDRAGGMWIGAYGGLTHYKDGKFTRWSENEGLPTPTIRALYLDGEGALWIGSYDSGLARFKNGKFTHYNTKNGLYNDGAFQILEDERRQFWLSSNQGIYRVNKDELNEFAEGKLNSITSIAYGKSDGMINIECNGGRAPGGIKARDGRLWFPTQDGVVVINPETIKINPKPPPVIIEDIKIDNKSIAFEAIDSAILHQDSAIRIESHQQNFEIDYTALSFINSEKLRFKYKLEGLDADWVEAGTRRTAYFSHVPAGEYTFRVIAANSDGVWNETGESLRITVLPPFYRTWWFLTLSVLTIAAVTYLLFKRRITKLERERTAQQTFARQLIASQEAERKRIAAELHDSLGQKLVVIKNLALMFLSAKNGAAEKTQEIEEISAEASEAISEVKTISYNLRPYQLDRIGLTKAVEAIIRTARAASQIDFAAEIDDIDNYFPKEEEINFYRIVQECVNNVVKHSGATEAKITIETIERGLDLTVSDNGRGFQPDDGVTNPQSKGFGLIGITERAELLGGRVEIKSVLGQGTIVKISLKR